MQKRLKPFLFLFILLYSSTTFSQGNAAGTTDALIARFTKTLETDNREKIAVHTDKWVYVAGETIWFKAYCFYEISNKLSNLSKTIFVDLVSDRDSVVSQLLLNNQRFLTEGRIVLPENLPEGDYWLRVYTNDHVKKDTLSVFVKHIYILNPKTPNPFLLQTVAEKKAIDLSNKGNVQIVFFPEGGSVIEGTDQTIALRVTDIHANPLSVSGYITNDEDSVVAKFNTHHTGFGKFSYYEENQNKYTLYLNGSKDHGPGFELPKASPNAARLSISKEKDTSITLQVALGDNLFKEEAATAILGINKDKIFYAASGKGMYEIDVPKKTLPEGESHFLLFNQQQQIISERAVYFLKNNINIDIKTDKENYQPREKVKLDISVTDANKLPLLSLLSVSVTDDSFIGPTSDVDELVSAERDLRMLTQEKHYLEWNWQANSTAQSNTTAVDNEFIGISGKILDKKGVAQKKFIVAMFSNRDEDEILLGTDTTNEKGHFTFPLTNYTDGSGFQLGVTNLNGAQQDVNIVLDTFLFPTFKTPALLKMKFNDSTKILLKEAQNSNLNTIAFTDGKTLLEPVTVVTTKNKTYSYDESKRVSLFSQILSSDMLAAGGVKNLSNALMMIPGVHLTGAQLSVRGGPTSMSSTKEPLLVIDGSVYDYRVDTNSNPLSRKKDPAPDEAYQFRPQESQLMSIINNYSPADIDFIEVLNGSEASYFGGRSGNGVVIINTKTASRKIVSAFKSGQKQYYVKGYLSPVPFKGTDYDKPEIKNSTNPDRRSTIYWNGNLLTDDNGKASFEFFTADAKTTYSLTVKGITASGEMIYKKTTIQRK